MVASQSDHTGAQPANLRVYPAPLGHTANSARGEEAESKHSEDQIFAVQQHLPEHVLIGGVAGVRWGLSRALLSKPSLYLSDFLERHRGIYYDALTRVRVSNDLAHWVKSFSYRRD